MSSRNSIKIGDIHPGSNRYWTPAHKNENSASTLLIIFSLSSFLSVMAFLVAIIALCKK